MLIMDVSLFGSGLGLADADPIGRFVACTLKPIFFNKSFQQIQRVIVGLEPVIADTSGI